MTALCGADNDSSNVGWGMELKRVAIGAAIVAAGVLGGVWLFQRSPVMHGTLRQACLDAHDRSLLAAYIRLPEGMTAAEYRERVLAWCDCVAREAQQRLPRKDLVAFVRNQMTPEIHSRIIAIYQQCPNPLERQAEPDS
jgi:hypothetical protein